MMITREDRSEVRPLFDNANWKVGLPDHGQFDIIHEIPAKLDRSR